MFCVCGQTFLQSNTNRKQTLVNDENTRTIVRNRRLLEIDTLNEKVFMSYNFQSKQYIKSD